MSLDKCTAAAAEELGLDKGEAQEIADRIKAERDRLAAAGGDLSRAEADLRQFAGNEAEKARIAAALKRKQAALNVIARDAFDKHIDAQVGRGVDLEESILSYLYGGPYSRDSVSARRKALEGDWLKGLLAESTEKVKTLEYHLGHPKESKGFFDNVVREMAELKEGGKPGLTKDAEAKAFADIVAKYREGARLEANRAGANIGKLEGSAGPQAHDEGKLLKAGVEPWKAAILEGLDIARSFGEGTTREDAAKILDEVFLNIVTGRDRAVSATQKGERLGPANLARSLEKHRVLHFKDADAWIRYSDQFGRGNVLTGILDELGTVARRVSLMQKLGPNPENMLGAVLETRARNERLTAAGREEAASTTIDKLRLGNTPIGKAYAVVSGNVDIPANVSRARFFANVRAVISMAKLGGSLLSQFSDLATYGAALKSQGQGYFEGYGNAIRGLVTGGGQGAHRRAALLGVGFDSILGDIQRRFDFDPSLRGRMASAQTTFFKLAGITWWAERLETAFANMTSAHMASHADKAFEDLDPNFAHTLGLNGLTGERWNVARQAVEEQAGTRYLLPEKIGELPDEAFDALVADRLKSFGDRQGQQAASVAPAPLDKAALAQARGAQETQHLGGIIDPTDTRPYGDLEKVIERDGDRLAGIQAHGIAGARPEEQLERLLTKGIDKSRTFHTGELSKALDANVRAGGLGAKTDAPYVLIGRKGESLKDAGPAAVVVNGAAKVNLDALRKSFPDVEFLAPDQLPGWKPGKVGSSRQADIRGKVEAERSRLIERERRELELDVRSYIAEETESGVVKGDDRTKAVVTQGSQAGSPLGEAIRFMGQFKSFPTAYYQKTLRRQLQGYAGADPSLQGLAGLNRAGQGAVRNFPAIATLIAASTVYGFASGVAKDFFKNREPKDWKRPATILAAMAQGGGLGLYGDFLFGEVSRFGVGPVSSAAGPFAGEADTIATLGLKARNRLFHPLAKPGADDAKASDFINFALQNTPFANLFYLRPVLDLAVLNQLQEWASPGTFARRKTTLQQQFGQAPIVDPLRPLGR